MRPSTRLTAPPVTRLLHRVHGRIATPVTRSPRVAYAVLGLLTVTALATVPFIRQWPTLLPSFNDNAVLVHFDGPPGTSLAEMDRIAGRAATELRSLAGIRDVGAHVGRAVLGDQVVGSNSAELWITIDPAADHDRTVASIRDVIDGYPGLRHSVTSYPTDRVADAFGDRTHDITVRISGPDSAVLRDKADEVKQLLASIKGVVNPSVPVPIEEPTIEVKVDLVAAQRAGVKPAMCAAPRARSCRASRSVRCSRIRRCSRSRCGVPRTSAATCRPSRVYSSTRRAEVT